MFEMPSDAKQFFTELFRDFGNRLGGLAPDEFSKIQAAMVANLLDANIAIYSLLSSIETATDPQWKLHGKERQVMLEIHTACKRTLKFITEGGELQGNKSQQTAESEAIKQANEIIKKLGFS